MDSIQFNYPAHYLFYITALAAIYALGLYFREKNLKENKAWIPTVLGTLRFLSVLIILFLLLTPLLRQNLTQEEKPIIVTLRDISSSISSAGDQEEVKIADRYLEGIIDNTADKYDWRKLYFGQEVKNDAADSLNALTTDISNSLEYVTEIYEDQNLGAIILLSDGIYNSGRNPIYSDLDMDAPIHTVAFGDTSQRRDVLVKNILHNRIVYSNDRFLVEIDVQAYNAKGNKSNLKLYRVDRGGNSLIESRQINIDSERFFETYEFELEAGEPGNKKYFARIDNMPNELSTENNIRNIYIEVLDARLKILLVSNSTHPDLKLLKQQITSNKNYELETVLAKDLNSSINSYDIIILHAIPSVNYPMQSLLQEAQREKIPCLFILGSQTDQNAFNAANNVITIRGENYGLNNVTPVLSSEFSAFTVSENLSNYIKEFVPLKAPFGEYSLNPAAQVLLYQKIGSVETPYPLLAYSDYNGQKQAVLSGEGIWRWALMEYFETEKSNVTKELLTKTIQYISQKEDKRQFRVFTNKRNYQENENVLFDAQLYNDNYELINTSEVALSITNPDNERFDYIFSKSNNYYVANAGRFPEGNYNYRARTEYNGKEEVSNGSFTVQSLMKENYDLTARHDILDQLSQKTGGEFIYPRDIPRLDSLIGYDQSIRSIQYQQTSTHSILDWPWLLLILLVLLSLEWLARRYFGGY